MATTIHIMDPAYAARDGWHRIDDITGSDGTSLNGDIKRIFFTKVPQTIYTSSARQPDDWSCGPYSIAETLGKNSGEEFRNWLLQKGLITSTYGTDHSGIIQCINAYGYGCTVSDGYINGQMNPTAYQQLIQHLQSGYKAILLMGGLRSNAGGACRNSYWSNAGHYICAYGISNGSSGQGSSSSSSVYSFNPKQIQMGSTGADVLLLQEILKARNLYQGSLDKMFGPQCLNAVKTYQSQRKLVVDGIVGPATWKDLLGM